MSLRFRGVGLLLAFSLLGMSQPAQAAEAPTSVHSSKETVTDAGYWLHEYLTCVQELRTQGYPLTEAVQSCQTLAPTTTPATSATQAGYWLTEYLTCVETLRTQGYPLTEAVQRCQTLAPAD